jgi:hypothetical protein
MDIATTEPATVSLAGLGKSAHFLVVPTIAWAKVGVMMVFVDVHLGTLALTVRCVNAPETAPTMASARLTLSACAMLGTLVLTVLWLTVPSGARITVFVATGNAFVIRASTERNASF